jgi:DNA invertase Pin-like site-specific DNA recombinase
MADPAPAHLGRNAYIYVRQSTLAQTVRNTGSLLRQYDLAGRARQLGWADHQIVVIDDDLGRSGASAQGRKGFSDLVADVGLGKAGIVLSPESSRLARNNADWYQLLGAPRGAVYSCGDGRAPPPGRRSGLVKLEAA